MKLFVVCMFVFVALSMAEETKTETPWRGCRYILGKCIEECPEGTHAYTTGCSPKTPEATCEEPNPVQERYAICDYSSCYCNPGTVRDKETNKCVKLEDCPKKEKSEDSPKNE